MKVFICRICSFWKCEDIYLFKVAQILRHGHNVTQVKQGQLMSQTLGQCENQTSQSDGLLVNCQCVKASLDGHADDLEAKVFGRPEKVGHLARAEHLVRSSRNIQVVNQSGIKCFWLENNSEIL